MSSPSARRAPVVTVEDFRARFPEFAENSDEQVQAALDDALPWNGFSPWGKKYVQGVTTLAAHLLALSNMRAQSATDAGGGMATGIFRYTLSRRAGALAVTYGAVGAGSSSGGAGDVPYFLGLTTYGIQWWSMARIVGMGALVLNATPILPGTPLDAEPPDERDQYSGRWHSGSDWPAF
ncbi:DUF4054 domain-containing protein [Paraburkholderia sp. BR10923]|uniref:DUF4054 domain-containing protein n=1 Tax=Paraburkholderia sp. BR10923 TaxID=3236992 RepID=UPI0034CFA91D